MVFQFTLKKNNPKNHHLWQPSHSKPSSRGGTSHCPDRLSPQATTRPSLLSRTLCAVPVATCIGKLKHQELHHQRKKHSFLMVQFDFPKRLLSSWTTLHHGIDPLQTSCGQGVKFSHCSASRSRTDGQT